MLSNWAGSLYLSVRWVLSELALVVNVIPGHLINVYNKIAVAHAYLNWLQKVSVTSTFVPLVCLGRRTLQFKCVR